MPTKKSSQNTPKRKSHNRKSREQHIADCRVVHGDAHDYSEWPDDVKVTDKVPIIHIVCGARYLSQTIS